MEMDAYEGLPVDKSTNQANIILKKKTYGGIPPGAGTRDDVIELFEELEQARYTLTQIQALLDEYPDSKNQYGESLDLFVDSINKKIYQFWTCSSVLIYY